MTRREVVRAVFEGKKPPYVPWSLGFTQEAWKKLVDHFTADKMEEVLCDHIFGVGSTGGETRDLGQDKIQDAFGVVWDRSADKDIGVIANRVLPEPTLKNYRFPDLAKPECFSTIPEQIKKSGDRFTVYSIGFSLYERAWTMRGMETLMMDFYDHPEFVRELLRAISDFNISMVKQAVRYDIDAVYFGDDWGQQHGLQMGPGIWHEFIYPELKRMYAAVRKAGKFVLIHSCGDVDELFDDLIAIGLNCFNPFQPEVMNVWELVPKYRGRLSFFGGLSTQKTLPYGTPEDVRNETMRLIKLGKDGGYIFSPAHAVEGDVPLENILAFIETIKNQPGFRQAG